MQEVGKRSSAAIAMAVFVCLYLLTILYSYYDLQIAAFLLRLVGYPLVCAFAGIGLSRRGILKRPDVALLTAYVLWIIVETLIVYRGYSYLYENPVYFAIGWALCCYPVSLIQTPDARRRAFRVTFHVVIAVVAAVCLVVLVAVIMGTHLETAQGLQSGLLPEYGYRLRIFSTHANYLAPVLCLSLLMSLYMILSYKSRVVRAYYVLVAVLMYVMLALTDSRTGMLSTAMGIGLLAMVLAMNRLKIPDIWLRTVAVSMITIAVVVVSFMGFSLALRGVEAVRVPAAHAQALGLQGRDLLDDLPTLTQRTTIWNEVFDSIRENPSILVKGVGSLHTNTTLPNHPQFYGRLHNSFLQVLAALGLPGLLLILAFLVVLAVHSVRVFFMGRGTLSEADQFVPALLVACLMTALVESFFFLEDYGLSGPLFFFIAGYVAATAGDVTKKVQGAVKGAEQEMEKAA